MLRSVLNMFTGRPTLCVFDLTTRCNSRCSMCSIWKRREKEMTFDEIDRVFSDLRRFGIHTIFLQGGEPLVRKDVYEVIKTLDKKGFRTVVLTNGILLNEKALERLDNLNSSGRISVTVSLDTLDRKKYLKIRGVDELDTVMKNIKLLSRYPGLRGGVHATITSINYMELEDIHNLVSKLGLEFTFNTYNDIKNYASSSDRNLHLGRKMDAAIKEMEKLKKKMPLIYRPFIDDNIRYLRGENIGQCDAFENSFRVTSEGMLSPCLEFPPVYDLKKHDINRNWKEWKDKMQCAIRRCYTRTPCFYGCTRGTGSVKKRPTFAFLGMMHTIK